MRRHNRLLESIRLVDGIAQLLPYHQERIERSLHSLGARPFFVLEEFVSRYIEQTIHPLNGVYKLRFEYDTIALYEPSCTLYKPRHIDSLLPYEIKDTECYTYKWADRQILEPNEATSKILALNPSSEVIFTNKGLLTDTRFSNIVLELGDGQWVTPRKPLLKGTMRQYLLDSSILKEEDLHLDDLASCRSFKLINAMLPI